MLQLLPRERAGRPAQCALTVATSSGCRAKRLRRLRGREIAVVFQDPMTSLNPVLSIGAQIAETMREHLGLDRREALARAVALLAEVGIPEAEQRARQYPHQMSGGMRQRVADRHRAFLRAAPADRRRADNGA